MARIKKINAKISLEQSMHNGELYPACVFSNTVFFKHFEDGLTVAKSILDPNTIEFQTVESILQGLSSYKASSYAKPEELPEEITEHFRLLPQQECTLDFLFNPLNNVPTEALFFSLNEIKDIVAAFELALENAIDEQHEPLNAMYESFGSFLNAWMESQRQTGTYFAVNEGGQ